MAKNKRRSIKIIIPVIVLILVVAGASFFIISRKNNKEAAPSNGSGSIGLSAPSESEKKETEQHKEGLGNDTPTKLETGTDGKKQVKPIISYADKTSVTAYVTGIFEEGGTCTATLTSGSKTITKTSVGFQNASYTQCAPIDLTSSAIGNDAWSVVVTYTSATATGKSDASTIKP